MSFATFLLNPKLIDALPASIDSATDIQARAIPAILSGKDVIALAQTGSGKTYAFGLPILHSIGQNKSQKKIASSSESISGLIIVPTRELAKQVADDLAKVSAGLDVRVDALCGGEDIELQVKRLSSPASVIVATPGRLLALVKQGSVSLNEIKHLVLDEADRLLDMGFIADINALIALMPERQTMLFSATMPGPLDKLTQQILSAESVRIETNVVNSAVEDIAQTIYHVNKGSKAKALIELIKHNAWSQVVVFVNGKANADGLCKKLIKAKINAAALHGDKEQAMRAQTLQNFKTKQLNVLVATDVLARGIHIDALPVVINFDLPEQAAVYVHRIGRTARAGLSGIAISLISHAEMQNLAAIRALTGLALPLHELENFPVTDKPVDPNSKRPPKDKQANRRTAKKRSIRDFSKTRKS
ncbi:DEAD/DEAH box helicase [Shewanella olleyana]|uniref:DEAD/DEAH box helicase n=1 Tax=Shewanella olleyana TaxID=135626 RepID=UPI00200F8B9F|nr:DEAD/DEAH box helicase [Shewanella olleyana]MCL1066631.1 DEAD/DEAH box helicase [Shewanella olleyana]